MSCIWPGLARTECTHVPDYYDSFADYDSVVDHRDSMADHHDSVADSSSAADSSDATPMVRFFSRHLVEFDEKNARGLTVVYLRRDVHNKMRRRSKFERPRYIYARVNDRVADPVFTLELNGRRRACPRVRIQRRNVWRVTVTDAVCVKDFGRSERATAIVEVNGTAVPVELAWICNQPLKMAKTQINSQ